MLASIFEGIAGLGINLPALIWQIINFSLLLILLYFILYKPMLRMMDQRSQRIKESLEQAERMRAETARAEEQVREQIEAARREGQNIISQAVQVGERIKEEARAEARKEAEALISRARAEIEREREEALEALRKEFADLAIRAAEKVVRQALDRQAHRKLIEEVLEEAGRRS